MPTSNKIKIGDRVLRDQAIVLAACYHSIKPWAAVLCYIEHKNEWATWIAHHTEEGKAALDTGHYFNGDHEPNAEKNAWEDFFDRAGRLG